ncbi:MAG: DUF5606 domain-containing protein [Bacteroidota bacterium]
MDIEEIISVSGRNGLFKVIAKTPNGLIVESLEDNKRVPVFASEKVSALKDISIFTKTESVPLKDVFRKIYDKENGGASIDYKSEHEVLKTYLAEVLPDYDEEKVYVSDIKKLIKWYNILQKQNLLEPEKEEKETSGEEKEKKPEAKMQDESKLKPGSGNKPDAKPARSSDKFMAKSPPRKTQAKTLRKAI